MRSTFPILSILLLLTPVSALAEDLPDVLATVNGEAVKRSEILELAQPQLVELKQKRYEALKAALERIITDRLVAAEAEKRQVDVETLLENEVRSKLDEPSEAQLKSMYEQYKNSQALRGKSFDQARPLLVREMQSRQAASLYESFLGKLRDASEIEVRLDPPRFDVSEGGNPAFGPESAPVTIVAFSDYECPYCSRAESTIQRLIADYPENLRVVFRDFPLSFHKNAQKAHEAAGCALEQGKFEEMHARLFENQRNLGVDALERYAAEIGLDTEEFSKCLSSDARAEEVQADLEAGAAVGVQGTPAFFVNGRFLNGAQPYEAFQAVIEDELTRKAPNTKSPN